MRNALLATAILGVICSAVLVHMSLPNEQGGTSASSLCAPTARVNCDYVLSSRWARIGPVPSAVVGLLYFATLACWYAFVGLPNFAGRGWHGVPLLLNAGGILASLGFVYVMAVSLPVWCTWCLAAHGVNGILFILAIAARPRSAPEIPAVSPHPSRGRALGTLGGCVGVVVTLGALLIGYQMQIVARQYQLSMLKATNNAEYVLWRFSQSPKVDVPVAADDFLIGKADAAHTLVVYSDFECVNCAGLHRYAARLTNLFPDSIRIAFRHFPLCRECNPHSPTTMHFFACEAARAAEAARRAGTWQTTYTYHQLLFDNASRLSERPYQPMAAAAGIDVDQWRAMLNDPQTAKRIDADVTLAHRLGVEGTPAIFLDGRRLESWHLLTEEPQPKVDLEATDRLWGILLGRTLQG